MALCTLIGQTLRTLVVIFRKTTDQLVGACGALAVFSGLLVDNLWISRKATDAQAQGTTVDSYSTLQVTW
jgi:hypothetical protein